MANSRIIPTHWYRRRWEILKRDNFTCRYCGQFAPNVMLQVDHVIPVCEGGTDDETNLVTACAACNYGKEGYRAHIAAKPKRGAESTPARAVSTLAGAILEWLRSSDEPRSRYEAMAHFSRSRRSVNYAFAELSSKSLISSAGRRGQTVVWVAVP